LTADNPAGRVVPRDFARLLDRSNYGYRFVLALFGFGDQHGATQADGAGDLDFESRRPRA
jgi:hypothetical protein